SGATRAPPRSTRTTAGGSSVRSSSRSSERHCGRRIRSSGAASTGTRRSSSVSTCRRTCSSGESKSGRGRCSSRVCKTRFGRRSCSRFQRRRAKPSASTRSPTCRRRRRSARSSCGRAATRRINANGCAASPTSLSSPPIVRLRRLRVTSSTWHAHGNVYLVAESDEFTMEEGLDGVVQVLGIDGDEMQIAIVNPDGSLAEMSGNGTRIAGAWLMERTGRDSATVHVGPRRVAVRRTSDGLYESELGEVVVGARETVEGVELTPVEVGNSHFVVLDDPAGRDELGLLLDTHPHFPNRTNVLVARVDGPGEVTARVWERGVGETTASGSSAVAVAAATHGEGEVVVHFPGGDLTVRLRDGRATLIGPAAPVSSESMSAESI